MLVKAVRKVAAGENFISPELAEAVTFSGASIKANPALQMTTGELEILRLLLLKQKLGAKNHSDLIRIAVEMGLD
jgi:DNA-binding NarL/FixJ family response regulator